MPESKVVCNSGPLISLASIKRVDLLKKLFDRIAIPDAVYREVVLEGKKRSGQSEIRDASWIDRFSITDSPTLTLLMNELDAGESEAIVLGIEIDANYVILDEKLGRRNALRLGLNVIGTLGILLMAKKAGFVSEVSPLLDRLEKQSFRMSRKIREMIRAKAGE